MRRKVRAIPIRKQVKEKYFTIFIFLINPAAKAIVATK